MVAKGLMPRITITPTTNASTTNYSDIIFIRSKYGENKIKITQKFEQFNYCLWKARLDLRLLAQCKLGNVSLSFSRFVLENRSLQSLITCKQCQLHLLKEEIRSKNIHTKTLER